MNVGDFVALLPLITISTTAVVVMIAICNPAQSQSCRRDLTDRRGGPPWRA